MPKIISDKSIINNSVAYIKKYDAFKNATSGYGGTYDQTNKITFQSNYNLTDTELESLYRYDWISRRVVEAIPQDSMREWITIDDKNKVAIEEAIKKFDLKKKIKEAFILARLYGGATMLLASKNSGALMQQLKPGSEITCINVIDKTQIMVKGEYIDPFKPNFGQPEIYELNAMNRRPGVNNNQSLQKMHSMIHESRLIRIDGNYLPDKLKVQNDGWHDSVLNSINTAINQCGVSLQSGAQLMQDFVTKVLKLPNLVELIATDNYETITARIQYALGNMSQAGIALIGSDEEFDKIQTPITGLVDLLNIYIEQVSGASGIPRSRLFSQSLGVLAGAAETTRNYYDFIRVFQKDELRPVIEHVLSLFNNGIPPTFEFNPLWIPTQKELAEIHKIQMEADAGYINLGTLLNEEVAISRFGGQNYSIETTLQTVARKAFNDIPRETKPNKEET